jgi:hypothetical protein
MTDPKLNELPLEAEGDFERRPGSNLTEAEIAERRKRTRAGLSIRDTVAGESTLSVGSRGVDTSGAEAGAGAGLGMTNTTPGNSGSPAPNIVPGARGSGTTARGDSLSSQHPTTSLDSSGRYEELPHDEIAARAYNCWRERGCPEGSAEVDWYRAEQELRAERSIGRKVSAATA